MTRDQAIEVARRAALNSMEGYAYLPVTDEDAATWMPHEWAVKAIISAERRGRNGQAAVTEKAFEAVNRNADLGEATREHLRLAVDHIAALNGALEDLASLGATIAICGTKYDDAAAREVLRPNGAMSWNPRQGEVE